jgi:hypothetical protein
MKKRLLSILLIIMLIIPMNNIEGNALAIMDLDNSISTKTIIDDYTRYAATSSDSPEITYLEKRELPLAIDNKFSRKNKTVSNKDIVKNNDEYKLIFDAYTLEEKLKSKDIVIVVDQTSNMLETIKNIYLEDMKAVGVRYFALHKGNESMVIFDQNIKKWCIMVPTLIDGNMGFVYIPIIPKKHENDEGGIQVYYKPNSLDKVKAEILEFIEELRIDSEINGVQHRVAIIGFGFDSNITMYTVNDGVGVQYRLSTDDDLIASLVDCNDDIIERALDNINIDDGKNKILNFQVITLAVFRIIIEFNLLVDDNDREGMFILISNSIPLNEDNEIDTENASWAVKIAQDIKNENVEVYSISVFPNLNEHQDNFDLFMELISSNYKKAEDMEEHGDKNEYKTDYYKQIADNLQIKLVFNEILEDIGIYDIEEPPTFIKEILSNQFNLSDSENAVRVFIENCIGIETSESGQIIYNFGERQKYQQVDIVIKGREIEISGFDFLENVVGIEGDTIFGSRIIVEIDIEIDKENCFGGNSVFVNDIDSGLYRENDAGVRMLVVQSDMLAVNIDIDYSVLDVDKYIYISDSVSIYEIINKSSPYISEINGENNKYIDIKYTLYSMEEEKLADFIITNGSISVSEEELGAFYKITEDHMEFVLKCQIIPVKPLDENREAVKILNEEIESEEVYKSVNIYVAKPKLENLDIKCYLGETKNLLDGISENIIWEYRSDNDKKLPIGIELDTLNIPTLIYKFEIAEGKGIIEGTIFTPKSGGVTYVNILVSVNIGEDEDWDISDETIFVGSNSSGYFINVETCSLILINNTKLNNLKSGKSFVVNIEGNNGLTYRIIVEAKEERIITGLPIGDYVIKEEQGWNWRYILSDESSVGKITLEAEEGLDRKNVYLIGDQNNRSWLAMDKVVTLK